MRTEAEELRGAVIALDRILTGKPDDAVAHTADSQNHLFAAPTLLADGELYYLSDGGYSRLRFHPETFRLSLDSVSRDEVKARWAGAEAAKAVETAEAAMARIVALLQGGNPGP